MAILKISRLGHPILFQKTKSVKNITGIGVKKIIHDMTETMLDAKGIGLAAPQIHINKQIIIFRTTEDEKEKEIKITALINPKLTIISDETDNEWEGCLSIPGMLGLVKRYSKIKYEGYVNIEKKRISRLAGLENTTIPKNFNYKALENLSSESKEKLALIQPETLGQASRIAGVRSADMMLLAFSLKP